MELLIMVTSNHGGDPMSESLFFWSSKHNFEDIKCKFCTFIPKPQNSVLQAKKILLFNLDTIFMNLGSTCHV